MIATQATEGISKEEVSKGAVLLTEADIRIEMGLPAKEVDRRLVSLARTDRQVEAALCFYLQEVDQRQLYREYGHASTEAYSRERLGFQDRKTRSLLFMAHRMDELPLSARPRITTRFGTPIHPVWLRCSSVIYFE